MIWKLLADHWRPAALMALATFSGCATPTPLLQRPAAPDLLNVSAVAPAINAGPVEVTRPHFGRVNGDGLRSAAEVPVPLVTPTLPSSAAEVPVSVDLPTLPGNARQAPGEYIRSQSPIPRPSERESAASAPDGLKRPEVNLDAGLMGPTPPVATPAASTPETIPQSSVPYPIDLSAALRLADVRNPVIGEARVLVLGALAERQAARALLLPYLNAGTNYHDHTGPVQRSNGTILPVTLQSLYVGGGAGAIASSPSTVPMVNIFSPLTDAIFEPLAAQQRVVGSRFNASDTANKVLLDVASLYIDLIGAEAILQARRELAADSDRIAASVAAYAATGEGRKSDADRAEADRRLFQANIQKAEERVAVASARLAERLNLDPSARLSPIAGPLEPLELINPEIPPDELIRSAVTRRPDLAARDALVSQAEYRIKQEQARPLLPTVWLGFSAGAFGGGSNLTANTLSAFAGRTDFDIRVYWTLLNFGAGNASLIKQRRAQAGEAIADRARVINQIRREVATARAESLALRSQVSIARLGFRTAEDGYRQDQTRLRETLALPIEALDSLRLLADARVALIEAITRANRTQFALFVALGSPPPLDSPAVGSSLTPVPPLPAGGN